jgi:hypothetical protein
LGQRPRSWSAPGLVRGIGIRLQESLAGSDRRHGAAQKGDEGQLLVIGEVKWHDLGNIMSRSSVDETLSSSDTISRPLPFLVL